MLHISSFLPDHRVNHAYSQGNKKACYNLGVFYEQGIAVEKDMQKALLYYMDGAKKGEENCLKAMVRLIDKGETKQ